MTASRNSKAAGRMLNERLGIKAAEITIAAKWEGQWIVQVGGEAGNASI